MGRNICPTCNREIRGKHHDMATIFKYPAETTVPKEVIDGWEDMSWHQDLSACCWKEVPTKKLPRAVFVLWVQADNPEERRLPEQGVFQLDFIPNSDEGFGEGSSILLISDSITEIMECIIKNTPKD